MIPLQRVKKSPLFCRIVNLYLQIIVSPETLFIIISEDGGEGPELCLLVFD